MREMPTAQSSLVKSRRSGRSDPSWTRRGVMRPYNAAGGARGQLITRACPLPHPWCRWSAPATSWFLTESSINAEALRSQRHAERVQFSPRISASFASLRLTRTPKLECGVAMAMLCRADILVCRFTGHSCPVSGDWKVARTGRLESLPYRFWGLRLLAALCVFALDLTGGYGLARQPNKCFALITSATGAGTCFSHAGSPD